jgi:hypothetical protein
VQPRDIAEFWMGQGAKVFPCDANGAPVGHLAPRGFHDAKDNPRELWRFDHEDTVKVGLVPGSMGVVVIDVDVKGGKVGKESLEAWEAEHGKLPRDLVVTTPSGGFHIYMRKINRTEHFGNCRFAPDIDVRSDGGYVIAPGSPGYSSVPPHFEAHTLPATPIGCTSHLRKLQSAASATPLDEAYEVERQAHVPTGDWHPKVTMAYDRFVFADSDRHDTMVSVTGALASYELLGYPGATTALERNLPQAFVLAVAADRRGGESQARLEYHRALKGARERVAGNESTVLQARKADDAFIEAIIAAGADPEVVAVVEALEEEPPPTRLRIYSMPELGTYDFNMSWLVRNVLITPTYGQIAGESKTLKTYLSQYLGLAVASGEKFLNVFDVDKTGPVLFLVGEGGMAGWTRRMPRIAQSMGIEDVWDTPIHATFTPAPFLSPMFRNTIEHALEHIDPVLTIIDPLYAFHGGEVEASNLHQEGALLTGVAQPFVEHGSTMLILNHWNKSSGGRSLKRITMAGSGEWVDSWMMTEPRGEPSLNTGDFPITVEFGSRQWGGSKWDLDFNIGKPNAMGGESDDPITFETTRSYE